MCPTQTTLNISTLPQLHKDLFWEIESRQSTQIDLKHVHEIDFSTIQLFIAASLYASSQEKHITYSNLHPQPLEAIKILGANTLLEISHG